MLQYNFLQRDAIEAFPLTFLHAHDIYKIVYYET